MDVGVTISIPEKGDYNDVNNYYRGITIMNAFTNVFSLSLRTRLNMWMKQCF